jgi:hypothetical protein
MHHGQSQPGDPLPTVANSILWDDQPLGGGFPIMFSYSDIRGGALGTGNIDSDPRFVDPANGDFRLAPGSPCIDAGLNSAVPEGIDTDLDGNPRFVDDPDSPDCWQAPGTCGDPPVVDMGAYEFQLPCPWDLNGDGVVNVLDLILLVQSFGPCDDPDDCPEDFDGDGFVGILDLLALLWNFGFCPGFEECPWDLNGDGVVDHSDLRELLQHLGPCDDPDDCPWDFDGDGFVGPLDILALVLNFGPCP